MVRKAVIPVAGLGTRVLPASKAIPKEMLPVVDKPAIQLVVEEAVRAGIKEIILITRSGKEAIENHFDKHYEIEAELARKGKTAILESVKDILPSDVTLMAIRQPDAKGLGHAVLCAAAAVGTEPFAVLLPDVLVDCEEGETHDLSQMIENFSTESATQVMVERVADEDISKYGIADCSTAPAAGTSAAVVGFVEKPNTEDAPSNLAVVGRYVFPARIMDLLKDTKPGAGDEIQLTDAMDTLLKEQAMSVYRMSGKTFDCGNKAGYVEAVLNYALKHPETKEQTHALIKQLSV
ncbi:UTP--glucose-1-phosphate uridylyltransferase GalU [Pontibacterium sp. N1Y112]|uniref:UTP--glucose-1-phosphate uridylyltransferase n=1 Tax=Pontibacterium sinense TaxID=2781979 RepID=A0A8J7FKN9_9GAMM|nr:UTP--glucose-1-phosphate uridylyltransferase GalU [Pontibacterium sinense]MBE9396432.1 UTP--glucose-1-phosphate uridylyltransferase GalU [Pontibacterium sinense]